jgi:hypothetical protein
MRQCGSLITASSLQAIDKVLLLSSLRVTLLLFCVFRFTLHQKLFGLQWRPLFITLLTLLVFSEMSYGTFLFCTLQDKIILHIYIYPYMCPAVHMQVWTHDPCFIWLSPKRPKGGVWPSKSYTKSRILKAPTDFAGVQRDVLWNVFVLYFTGQNNHIYIYIYICPAIHIQVWTHDPCFIWSSPKRPTGVVWGSCVGCNRLTPPKFVGGLKCPASWVQTKKP